MTTRKLYSEELVQLSESLEEMGNLVGLSGSAEPSADIILCAFILRMGKDLLRIAEFHHFSHEEKSEIVRNTGSLLHIVGNHDDRQFIFQFLRS
mgnify:CR=1 FL=1